jgi:hypothetical protein
LISYKVENIKSRLSLGYGEVEEEEEEEEEGA